MKTLQPGVKMRPGIQLAHLLVLLVALPGLLRLESSADTRVFFGDDNPYFLDLQAVEDTFSQNNNVLLMLRYEGRSVVESPAFADIVREATDAAWRVRNVLRVDSLANHPHLIGEDGSFRTLPVLDYVCPDECRAARREAAFDPVLIDRLISEDGTTAGVFMLFDLPYVDATPVREIADAVRDLAASLEAAHPGLTAEFVGGITMMDAFAQAAERDASLLVPLVLVVMTVLLVLLMGEPVLVSWLLGAGVYGALVVMGAAGWLGMTLNAATSIAPVIIIVLIVAGGMHLVMAFRNAWGESANAAAAAERALALNTWPILLASITTIVGFASMNTADAPPIRELGNLVCAGMLLGTSMLLLVLPAWLARRPRLRVLPTAGLLGRWMSAFASARRGTATALSSVLVVAGVAGLTQLRVNDDFVEYFDKSFEFRIAAEFAREHLAGPNTLDIQVSAGAAGGAYTPEYMQTLAEFAAFLRAQELVSNVVSLADVVADLAREFEGHDDFSRMSPDAIAQYLLAYELSLGFGQNIADYIDKPRRSTRVAVLLGGGNSRTVIALEERIYAWFRTHAPPGYGVVVSGVNVPVAHMSLINIEEMLDGTVISLVLISLIVAIYFRSVLALVVTVAAICLPIAAGFGVWGWLFGDMGLAGAVIAAATIGLVVDDAIHLMYRYRLERETTDAAEAARRTLASVGQPVVATSVALAAGFLLLMLSGFEINRALGFCTAIIVVCALMIDLFIVPAVLVAVDRLQEQRKLRRATP